MSDASTTVDQLKQLVNQFVTERDWAQFHTPKNLSMSIAIEAAELMEHFQWHDSDGSRANLRDDPEAMEQIREELADILCYAISFANALKIDIDEALRDKLVKNAQKYPADRFRGRFK
ncbi:MAG TPA: nucleotide pyrophosphohydrolase [Phycisphaerae bacterium]|nr:nucleotide pyrophosphohydrolase [Phycisphaerae bacterium]